MSKKVLIPVFKIQDYGGVINWAEHLCHGFKAIGWEPKIVRLEEQHTCHNSKSSRDMCVGYSGLAYHQKSGWHFPISNRVPLLSTNWKKYTSVFNLIVWAVPTPSVTHPITDWQHLYTTASAPQIMVIHDGNLNKRYPQAYEVMGKCAVVGVHNCAKNSIDQRYNPVLIPNPQVISRLRKVNYKDRTCSILCLQTFKHWKHVDDLVRAAPLIYGEVIIAGGGIEYYYMAGVIRRKRYGTIWDAAIESGMKYLGWLDEVKRDKVLSQCRLLLDPSWSTAYAKYGSHFNRVFVDAIIMGCLPAATDSLMEGNNYFSNNDYVTIPYKSTASEYANVLNEAMEVSEVEYTRKLLSLQEVVVENFDSVKVAISYVNLVK